MLKLGIRGVIFMKKFIFAFAAALFVCGCAFGAELPVESSAVKLVLNYKNCQDESQINSVYRSLDGGFTIYERKKFMYNGIIYIPIDEYYGTLLGIGVEEKDDAFVITALEKNKYNPVRVNGMSDENAPFEIFEKPVYIEGKKNNLSTSEYPFGICDGAVYLPLTYDVGMALGWIMEYDDGLYVYANAWFEYHIDSDVSKAEKFCFRIICEKI